MDTVLVQWEVVDTGFQAQHLQKVIYLLGKTATDMLLQFIEDHLSKGILIGYDTILGKEMAIHTDHGVIQKELIAEYHFIQSLFFEPCGGSLFVVFDCVHILCI